MGGGHFYLRRGLRRLDKGLCWKEVGRELFWAILGYSELFRVILDYSKLFRVIPSYSGLFQVIPGYSKLFRVLLDPD